MKRHVQSILLEMKTLILTQACQTQARLYTLPSKVSKRLKCKARTHQDEDRRLPQPELPCSDTGEIWYREI